MRNLLRLISDGRFRYQRLVAPAASAAEGSAAGGRFLAEIHVVVNCVIQAAAIELHVLA